MPYGAETNPNIAKTGQGENPVKKSFSVLFNCSKHPGFWVLSSTFFICGFTSNGLVSQHFIPFCSDNNIGIIVASSYLATIGLFNFMGSIGSGWLADKFDNYKLLATFYSVRGLSLVYLPFSSLDVFYLTIWAIFFGLDFIATIPPTGRFCSKFFGSIDGPIAFAWIFSIHQIGAASAAYGAGRTRDIFLTYEPVFLLAGLACFIATLLLLGFRLTPQSQLDFQS
jgi:predicted MFS family arabinose efflux permease